MSIVCKASRPVPGNVVKPLKIPVAAVIRQSRSWYLLESLLFVVCLGIITPHLKDKETETLEGSM